jgi:hypothetical protein
VRVCSSLSGVQNFSVYTLVNTLATRKKSKNIFFPFLSSEVLAGRSW